MNKYKTDVLSELINNERHQIKEQFELEKENIRNNLLKEKDKEIEKLNQKLEENTKIYLNTSKYASEMEGKYILEKAKNEKANWWLKEMLKQAKSEETKAIINGALELLNGGDDNG